MKTPEFQALIEQLGDLSEVQRSALFAALKGNGSANDVIALIETRFAVAPVCGHCKSEAFGSWGVASGLRRYKCERCSRTFNALTGTPLAQLHRREAWLEYARALVDGVSLRKAAERCGIHLETSFRWRHRFLASAKTAKAKAVTGIVEADETFIRKSARARKISPGGAQESVAGRPGRRGFPPTITTRFSLFAIAMERRQTRCCPILKGEPSPQC